MAEFTPGPWKHKTKLDRHWIEAGKGALAFQVADVTSREIENDEGDLDDCPEVTEANANLIATAPDLLAACELAEGVIVNACGDNEARFPELKVIRAAIAKARGK